MSAGAREIVPFEPPTRPFDALGCDLAELVREQFTTYVAFHADFYDAEADVPTLWTLHPHVFGAAEATPYLLVTAPTPEAGKSRILDVAQHLVARPEVVVDPSAASLFRIIDHYRPTLLIDQIDQLYKSRPLRAVLNAGHRQHGGHVTRVETVEGARVPVRYNVFAPKWRGRSTSRHTACVPDRQEGDPSQANSKVRSGASTTELARVLCRHSDRPVHGVSSVEAIVRESCPFRANEGGREQRLDARDIARAGLCAAGCRDWASLRPELHWMGVSLSNVQRTTARLPLRR